MGSGGSTTRVVNTPATIPDEAKPFFRSGAEYYNEVVRNPPVYGGDVAIEPSSVPALERAQRNVGEVFGYTPGFQQVAQDQAAMTAAGSYLNTPMAEAAVRSLASPIFRQFETEVMPMIRDRSQFAGQGLSSSRRGVAQETALETFGEALATGALAPIYTNERDLMLRAAGLAPELMGSEAQRLLTLNTIGQQQYNLESDFLDRMRRQGMSGVEAQQAAADRLLSTSNFQSTGGKTTGPGEGFGVNEGIQVASALAAIAAAAIIASCHIARALYGNGRKARMARYYIFRKARGPLAHLVRYIYRRHGEWIASKIQEHRWLRTVLTPLMDFAVRKGEKYASQFSQMPTIWGYILTR